MVKNYLRSTFDKMGGWSRLELALYVANHGGGTWLNELQVERPIESVHTEQPLT